MADRVTKVRLSAVVSDYVAGMEKAARATRDVTSEASKLEAQKEVLDAVGAAALAVGALAAVGVGLAVVKFAEFDKQMSSVQAATQESTANMAALRGAALDAGAGTVFSATEAARAIEELGKAGVSTKDVLAGGLTGALDLAAAGELEVGRAAEVAASALTQFNLSGKDVPRVADILAAGAGKAQGSVEDMSQALGQSGLVASQMGLSLEETVGSLAAFASAGLIGSDAGTSFRSALLRLANPTGEAKQLMDDLGISAYDAAGQFVGMESLAGQLQTRLGNLTQAQRNQTLAVLFGQDAIRAANVLYVQGAKGIADWTAKVDDAGYAAKVAEDRMNNLAGDVEKLGGAFDTALIQSGSAANEALRALVQTATAAVDGFSALPVPMQQAALGVAAVGAAVALAGGAFILGVPKVAEYKAALDALELTSGRAGTALSILGKVTAVSTGAFAALSIGLGIYAQKQAEAQARTDELTAALEASNGALDENVRKTVAKQLQDKGVFDTARLLKISVEDVTSAALGNDAALQRVTKRLAELDKSNGDSAATSSIFAEKVQSVRSAVGDMSGAIDESRAKLDEQAAAQGAAADGADRNSAALAQLEDNATSTEEAVSGLADAIRGFGSAQLDVNAASRDFEAALDDLQASIEANGSSLDVAEESGRANQAAIDAVAKSTLELAAATIEQTGSQEQANGVIQSGRDRLVEMLGQFGLTTEQAAAYADQLGLIPSNVATGVTLFSDEAFAKAEAFRQKLADIPNSKEVYLYVEEQRRLSGAPAGQVGAAYNANGGMYSYANGGFGAGFYKGGTPLYKFAEPETRWEAFISGKQGQEDRNRGIALEAYRRLGGDMGSTTNNYQFEVRTIDQDPMTQMRVLGREFSRGVAG